MTPLFSPFASQHHNVTNHPPPPLFLFLCPPFFPPLQSVSVFIPLSPSSFPLPPTLTYTFLLLLLSSSSSGRFLLHDQPLFGSRVWGGGRPVLLLGHNLRWSHVHPGSCRDPSGELLCLLCFGLDVKAYVVIIEWLYRYEVATTHCLHYMWTSQNP